MKKIFLFIAAALVSTGVWAAVDLSKGATYDLTTLSSSDFTGTNNNYWKPDSQTPTYYGNGSSFKPETASAFILNADNDEITKLDGLKLITGSSTGRARLYVNGNGLYFNSNAAKLVMQGLKAGQTIVLDYANVSSNEANFTVTNATAVQNTEDKKETLTVTADGEVTVTYNSQKFYLKKISISAAATTPLLDAITIAGIEADIIALNEEDQDTISAELPFGTIINDAIDSIKAADVTLGGTATSYNIAADRSKLTVSDGVNTKDYIFDLTVSASASTDATLKSLSINGVEVALTDGVYEYNVELAYTTTVVATFTENDPMAEATADYSTEGKVIITVEAQAGNKQNYTVNYTILPAYKDPQVITFSNGARGSIVGSTITVPYLSTEEIPTFVAVSAWYKKTGTPETSVSESTLTITGIDGNSAEYTIVYKALTPASSKDLAYDTDITFTANQDAPAYIYAPYNADKYDDTKGWKIAQYADAEGNRRITSGNTNLYFAFRAAESVILTNEKISNARNIEVLVNGVKDDDITSIGAKTKSITIPLNTAGNNFVMIRQTNSGGDAAFSKLKLVKGAATSIDNTSATTKAQKRIENGQLIIEKNGVRYNAMGQAIR